MSFAQILVEAFRSLSANRLRTALTMLGIIIGIASVVLMLSVGDSVRKFIDKELSALGSNMLIVRPGTPTKDGGVRRRAGEAPALTIEDAAALNTLPTLKGAVPMMQGFHQINYGTDNSNTTVLGVVPEVFALRNWTIDSGAGISESDVRSAARVAVIGSKIASQYFYKTDPIGKLIRVDNQPYTVVGVMAGEGSAFDVNDIGDVIMVPITRHPIRMPLPRTVHYFVAQAKDAASLKEAQLDMADVLRDRHRITPGKEDNFVITNLASFAQAGANIGFALSIGLGLIGAISLIVGGIGIMNIMLVSVSERVREIGIRMAIGAKPRHVLTQFLAEAVVMCVVGGAIGTLIAAGGAAAVTATGKFDMVLGVSHVVTAVLFSTAVGLFFGFYPARRASRLLPIECLRQD
ncbi:ABC transporter permease [Piscinibacterium candidicorallinum]|uniref:ABC transporter permease n=1 Tax=Piscinibacterium candidicorallinum TaxID=1793872 RepID=A0ABV7H727_9BURK